jgi:hypothetical protein
MPTVHAFPTPIINPDSILCSDGHSWYKAFSSEHGTAARQTEQQALPILERLNLDPERWCHRATSFLLSFFFDPLIGIPAKNFARLKPTVFQNSLGNAGAVCHNPY